MPCYPVKENGKHVGFICGSLELEICSDCQYPADNLCDYPVGDGKTCDRLMCEDHSHHIGRDTHYCEFHYNEWGEFVKGGGINESLKNVIPFEREKNKSPQKAHTGK